MRIIAIVIAAIALNFLYLVITICAYHSQGRYPIALVRRYTSYGHSKAGRLVIYHAGKWGFICQNRISKATIGGLCKLLGFGSKGSIWSKSLNIKFK